MITNNSNLEQVAYAEASRLMLNKREYFFSIEGVVYVHWLLDQKTLKTNESVLQHCFDKGGSCYFLYYLLFTLGISVTLHGQVHMTKRRPHALNSLEFLWGCFLTYALVSPLKKRSLFCGECEIFLKIHFASLK